jgi:hypothetical protein
LVIRHTGSTRVRMSNWRWSLAMLVRKAACAESSGSMTAASAGTAATSSRMRGANVIRVTRDGQRRAIAWRSLIGPGRS